MNRVAVAVILFLAAGCAGPAARSELTVYAAVSLRQPLLESQSRLEEVAGSPIVFNFGASNDLAGQIIAARRADLFLSADEIQVRRLQEAGLIAEGGIRPFLSNRLVIVVPATGPVRLSVPEDLASPGIAKISIADPSGVPAGRYAREWLEHAGLWDRVRERIAPAIDARAALAAVESGGAQAGVVYRTDAALSERVRVVYEIAGSDAPEIRYVGAVLRDGASREAARRLIDHLEGPEGFEVFRRHGFVLP